MIQRDANDAALTKIDVKSPPEVKRAATNVFRLAAVDTQTSFAWRVVDS